MSTAGRMAELRTGGATLQKHGVRGLGDNPVVAPGVAT